MNEPSGQTPLELPASLIALVGIGGSAGSIGALRSLIAGLAPDCGLAVVVVIHLAPDHESSLTSLLQHATALTVVAAETGQKLERNHVYVIPPAKHLVVTDGHLRLNDLPAERGKLVAIDIFFRTLAETHGNQAAAIVLSGAGSDGSIGIKLIKERGGLTIAQNPREAEHPDMPNSAIATGMIDWVLDVAEMPAKIQRYFELERRIQPPPEDGPHPARALPTAEDSAEAALRGILVFLHRQTGTDFSHYKRATIVRRVTRRVQVNGLADFSAYLEHLQKHPAEVEALSHDLLICVTHFFRDPPAFRELASRLPGLWQHRRGSEPLRIWSAGCATGEEAYSLAMILSECSSAIDPPPTFQIFASDLSAEAVQQARQAIYPETIVADVSPERLERFFTRETAGYRVRKELRERVLCVPHDLLKDPPFARLDLVSCRNLLIYLDRAAQQRAFAIFHFSLAPGGLLFLGSSESLLETNPDFTLCEKNSRIYAARPPQPALTIIAPTAPLPQRRGAIALGGPRRSPGRGQAAQRPRPWSDAHSQLIDALGPPTLLINRQQEILHVSTRAAKYLQFGEGEPSTLLLRAIHPGLQAECRAALFRARQTGAAAETPFLDLAVEPAPERVQLRILPGGPMAPDLVLVLFAVAAESRPELPFATPAPSDEATRELERELESLRDQSRDAVEQYESSSEQLKASNEELQSMNEEMRAATEELETGREELQSSIEELGAVNLELKVKIDELARLNGDLRNLMGASAIASIFLDTDLKITLYTPSALDLFHLIPADLGRPLADLAHRLRYPDLLQDARLVLDRVSPIKNEVRDEAGRWHLAHLLPYRTSEDRVGGVVLTFVDITDQKTGEDERLRLNGRLIMAQEEERRRISRGLHDVVGQNLTALSLGLQTLKLGSPGPESVSAVSNLELLTEAIGVEIHDLALELRPSALDDLGLVRALRFDAAGWSKQAGVPVNLYSSLGVTRFPPLIEITLYRIVREALNNIAKHAQARQVSLIVEQRSGHAVAIIEDDGIGFQANPAAVPESGKPRLGLVGMEERARLIGGHLTMESSPGRGTTVFVRIPL